MVFGGQGHVPDVRRLPVSGDDRGSGTRGEEPDAELLGGFSAVLGISVEVLGGLVGMSEPVVSGELPGETSDTAALLWDVRHLAAAQVREVRQLAKALG
ncbi:hypothetical protein [Saccharothrix syringae]|uniref:Uncharacterized protein n=1 Tax=Saccharothrix syringae TaxID=103733 RepID=A0A5Q0GUY6_SACSY|nr:hypothetical protein [Saccharothrix syringae]QFZ17779.1 hypothetical protein EKG83_10065 [Saccharothrix syringae]